MLYHCELFHRGIILLEILMHRIYIHGFQVLNDLGIQKEINYFADEKN